MLLVFTHAASGGIVLFDDFAGSTLDTSKWEVGTWELAPRTFLGSEPVFGSEGAVDFATLTLDTYDPAHVGTHLLGTEILSKVPFQRGDGIEFEARVRVRDSVPGLVASFFAFEVYTNLQDEIDFEFITKEPTNTIFLVNWDDWDPANPIYNDGVHHQDTLATVPGLDRGNWNTLKFEWGVTQTIWSVNGIVVTNMSTALPDEPMKVRANFWAPGLLWTNAYDGNLQPTGNADSNVTYYYDVDYIKVSRRPHTAGIADIAYDMTNISFSITNLAYETTHTVERSFDLLSGIWEEAGRFLSTSPFANWAELVSNDWDKVYYRVRSE